MQDELFDRIKSRLTVGETYKNFKYLCNLIELDKLNGGGDRKTAQKVLSQYIEYYRVPNKQTIEIKQIYSSPKYVKKKTGTNKKYVKYTIPLLENFVSNKNKFKIFCMSKLDWFSELNFINSKYYEKYNNSELHKFTDLSPLQINRINKDFKYLTYDFIQHIFYSTMNVFKKTYNPVKCCNCIKYKLVGKPYNKTVNIYYKNKKDESLTEIAYENDDLYKLILDIEKQMLALYKFKSLKEIFENNLEEEFYTLVTIAVNEQSGISIERYKKSFILELENSFKLDDNIINIDETIKLLKSEIKSSFISSIATKIKKQKLNFKHYYNMLECIENSLLIKDENGNINYLGTMDDEFFILYFKSEEKPFIYPKYFKSKIEELTELFL